MGNCYMGVGLIVSVYPLRKLFTLFLCIFLKTIQHVAFAISLNGIIVRWHLIITCAGFIIDEVPLWYRRTNGTFSILKSRRC